MLNNIDWGEGKKQTFQGEQQGASDLIVHWVLASYPTENEVRIKQLPGPN